MTRFCQLLAIALLAACRGEAQAQQAQEAEDGAADVPEATSTTLPAPPSFNTPELEAARRGHLPLKPEEILWFRKMYNDAERAKRQPLEPAPKAIVVTHPLKPATDEIFAINLYPSLTTTITFLDSTGQAWPVEAFRVSNASAFSVEQPREGDNSLTITPLEPWARGNLVVYLPDVASPFIFLLGQGDGSVHLRVDFPVSVPGPQALLQVAATPTAPNTDPVLIDFLNNTPPDGAVELAVDGVDPLYTRAWRYRGNLFFRTPFPWLSPDYKGRSNGLGQAVYKLQPVPNVVVSVDGRPTHVTITERAPS